MFSRALLVLLQTPQHTHAILRRQKLGLVGEIVHEEEGKKADENGQCTLDDEDPGPSSDASLAVQLLNGSRKETSKGASQRGGGEEDGGADTEFVALVPAREIVVDTGEQAGLGSTEEPSRGHETRPVLDKAHSKHACAPNDAIFISLDCWMDPSNAVPSHLHDDGNKDGGAGSLEQEIGQSLKNGIGDEEDCERRIVLRRRHGNVLGEVGHLGVADVCAIEEAHEIQKSELGDQLLAGLVLYQAPVIASDSGYPVAFQGTAGKERTHGMRTKSSFRSNRRSCEAIPSVKCHPHNAFMKAPNSEQGGKTHICRPRFIRQARIRVYDLVMLDGNLLDLGIRDVVCDRHLFRVAHDGQNPFFFFEQNRKPPQ